MLSNGPGRHAESAFPSGRSEGGWPHVPRTHLDLRLPGAVQQVWQWAIRLPDGRKVRHREHPFLSACPPGRFLNRLQGLRFTLDEEENASLVQTLERVQHVLDTAADLNLFARYPSYAERSDELARAMLTGDQQALHRFVVFHMPLARV